MTLIRFVSAAESVAILMAVIGLIPRRIALRTMSSMEPSESSSFGCRSSVHYMRREAL
ncbi:MAG: hypothetical protein R6U27_07970 [Desulfobacterales bacterium]